MEVEMKLREPYFSMIESGNKIYEIRLNDEKRQQLKAGDKITFVRDPSADSKIHTEIVDILHYDNFVELFNFLPLNKMGFNGLSPQQAVDEMHKFYSQEAERFYGVIAIKVKMLEGNN